MFKIINFKDTLNRNCSIQESSLASEPNLWIGLEDTKPLVNRNGTEWQEYEIPDGVLLTQRMELNQQQIKEILPFLKKFARTGKI
jgi:uncharacterized protein with von Willebrand factor type A (vWA) domain